MGITFLSWDAWDACFLVGLALRKPFGTVADLLS
jgi:hypothetical protein